MMYTSSIWFSLILSFFGVKLKLLVLDANGKSSFTVFGVICTIVIILFSSILIVAQRYYEYKRLNIDTDKRKLVILEHVDLGTDKICDNKFITLKKLIYKIKVNGSAKPPNIISNPSEQLKHIIEKMNSCLCSLLTQAEYKINENELYISLYYNLPLEDENKWFLADSLTPEKGLSCDELLKAKKSTFMKVLNSDKQLVFWNSKEDASKNKHYIQDEEDRVNEKNELQGSIACYKIEIKHDNKELIKAVLSITTYSKRFVNSSNKKIIENVQYNISEHILSTFCKRIKIELCLLYLLILGTEI